MDETNPSVLMKSIKNETEQKNTVNAHIKDGVAVTRFIYWLKQHDRQRADHRAYRLRQISPRAAPSGERFLELELRPHPAPMARTRAIVHYEPTEETDIPHRAARPAASPTPARHYLEGTTDITRTIALGAAHGRRAAPIYTRVLRWTSCSWANGPASSTAARG